MHHLLLRVMLAVYLAVWSPAVCCCSLKHAFDGRSDGASHADVAVEPWIDRESHTCCSQQDRTAGADANRHLSTQALVHVPDDDSSPCRCHESSDSKIRLDTGSKIAAPALARVADQFQFIDGAVTLHASGEARCASAVRLLWRSDEVVKLPKRTLFDQRTLLLI